MPIFALPAEAARKGGEEENLADEKSSWDGTDEAEEGGSARLNRERLDLFYISLTAAKHEILLNLA